MIILDADYVCSSKKHVETWRSLESSEMSTQLSLTYQGKKARKMGL